MIGSSFATHSDEIVYDSEPERLQIRVDRRQRKLQRLNAVPPGGTGPSAETTDNVGHKDDRACSVIELTDSDDSSTMIPAAIPIASSSKTPQDAERDSDKVAPVRTLDVNQFAFAGPVCKKGRATTNNAVSRAASAPSTRSRRAPSNPVKSEVDILPSDLDKISRCIGCGIEWTTRKTSKAKLNHIRSCAKEHYLDHDTVRVLVQQEVAKYTPLVPGKIKGSVPKEPLTKSTFYEEVLGDAAPKKRTKRHVAQTLLSNVSANREDILARAETVLQAAPSVTPASRSLRETTPEHSNDDLHQQSPLPTQHFGTSRLAQTRHYTAAKPLFGAIYSSPPARHNSTLSSSDTSKTPLQENGQFTQFDEGDNTNMYGDIRPPNDTSSNDNLRNAFQSLTLEQLDQQDIPPEAGLSNKEENIPSIPAKAPGTRKKRVAEPKTPKPPKKPKLEFEEEWEAYMKEAIMKDDSLYMRVLRYEPIHFNEFVPLAESFTQSGRSAASTAKLKAALRKYLDDQAIHFHDDSAWRRR